MKSASGFIPNSEIEKGARPPRAQFSAPSRKTTARGMVPRVTTNHLAPNAGREGASSHARGGRDPQFGVWVYSRDNFTSVGTFHQLAKRTCDTHDRNASLPGIFHGPYRAHPHTAPKNGARLCRGDQPQHVRISNRFRHSTAPGEAKLLRLVPLGRDTAALRGSGKLRRAMRPCLVCKRLLATELMAFMISWSS
jgi:hypothetical protein